jgi:hypothetical protein
MIGIAALERRGMRTTGLTCDVKDDVEEDLWNEDDISGEDDRSDEDNAT